MAENKSIFETLYAVDVSEKIKEKNGLKYLSWSSAWAEVKKVYPNAVFKINEQVVDELGNTRFWHDDGRYGWVSVSITIGDQTETEILAIMDFKNKSIPAENITSTDANKSLKRCLVKCLALFGLATYIYEGEDMPEEASEIIKIRERITELVTKKVKLSDRAKEKVAELCKQAEKEAFPYLNDDLITGNYKTIDEIDVLRKLEKRVLAVRK